MKKIVAIGIVTLISFTLMAGTVSSKSPVMVIEDVNVNNYSELYWVKNPTLPDPLPENRYCYWEGGTWTSGVVLEMTTASKNAVDAAILAAAKLTTKDRLRSAGSIWVYSDYDNKEDAIEAQRNAALGLVAQQEIDDIKAKITTAKNHWKEDLKPSVNAAVSVEELNALQWGL